MNIDGPSAARLPLRILLVGAATAAGSALAAWLGETPATEVIGPARTTDDAVNIATTTRPHIVLLDFHGLPVSTAHIVSRLKALTPSPRVFVLTHDASPAMRRRCQEARVDRVFDKTAELEELRWALSATSGLDLS